MRAEVLGALDVAEEVEVAGDDVGFGGCRVAAEAEAEGEGAGVHAGGFFAGGG